MGKGKIGYLKSPSALSIATAVITRYSIFSFPDSFASSRALRSRCEHSVGTENPRGGFQVIFAALRTSNSFPGRLQLKFISYPTAFYTVTVFPFIYLSGICFPFLHGNIFFFDE